MSSKKDDIIYSAAYLRRYWNGELSPEEMHALEKAALDDPFLADAMEGFGEAMQQYEAPVIDTQLETMRRQLQAQPAQPSTTAPVRSFRWWQAAAAVIILAGSAMWFYYRNHDAPNKGLAHTQPAPATQEQLPVQPDTVPTAALTDTGFPDKGLSDASEAATAKVAEPTVARPRSTAPPVSNAAGFTRPARPDSVRQELPLAEAVEKARLEDARRQLQHDRAQAIKELETEVVRVQEQAARRYADTGSQPLNEKLQDFISGVVTDHRNNPLANAFVQVENYRSNYFTDMQGFFKIPVTTDSPIHILVGSPGFASQRLQLQNNIRGNASLSHNRISLVPNDSLADLVVTGYGNADKKAKKAISGYPAVMVQNAQPVQGWVAYEAYLSKNKKIPSTQPDTTGQVTVSFEVNRKGELSDFRIEQSLSEEHDAEALRLVREGPKWKLLRGRKARATVIVRF